ncbi:MAG: Ca-activated chloride channel family protein [Myxococcota bacterium]|jgi:Ca-activated chloride channel family protein
MECVDTLCWGDDVAWLWALVGVGLLLGFVWLAQWRQSRLKELAARGPLPAMLDARSHPTGWLMLRAGLVVGAVVLIAAALAQPRWGSHETEVAGLGIDVAVVLDASKSMMLGDIVPNRLEASKYEVDVLLRGLQGGRVALIPFAGLAFTQTPLTTDFEVVRSYLRSLRTEDIRRGGTAIGRGLMQALHELAPDDQAIAEIVGEELGDDAVDVSGITVHEGAAHKAIILLSDGENHESDALEAAQHAARLGIRVYTVGVGTTQGRPVLEIDADGKVVGTVKGPDGKTPLFSALDVNLLKDVARITGGDYFHLGTGGLGAGLASALGKLEKAEYEQTFAHVSENRFQWAVWPALLLLLIEALIGRRRRRPRG